MLKSFNHNSQTYEPDTYEIATSSGDAAFLEWIYQRLAFKYDEYELYDFMHTLKAFCEHYRKKAREDHPDGGI